MEGVRIQVRIAAVQVPVKFVTNRFLTPRTRIISGIQICANNAILIFAGQQVKSLQIMTDDNQVLIKRKDVYGIYDCKRSVQIMGIF